MQGYPYLRINRFLATFADSLAVPAARLAWLEHLRQRDMEARRLETANRPGNDDTIDQLEHCGRQLIAVDAQSSTRFRQIRARAVVPDNYSRSGRIAGAYAITGFGVAAGVARWERETLERYAQPAPFATDAMVLRIDPSLRSDADRITPALPPLPPLPGYRPPAADVAQRLLQQHAPAFIIEQRGDFDRPGRIRSDGRAGFYVDTASPVMYTRVAATRYADHSLTQLVYTLWFTERPATSAFDIYAGHLDGVTLRITLDRNGEPAVVDTIHPCGCYHLFLPTANAEIREIPPGIGALEEWRLIPATLPAPAANERLVVSISSGSHQVVAMHYEPAAGTNNAVALPVASFERASASLIPADSLRSLVVHDDADAAVRRQSLYRSNGLVAGTHRSERFLLWPMGIASAGAMRQWGHHATAFVGRRHFDDATLMEARFGIR